MAYKYTPVPKEDTYDLIRRAQDGDEEAKTLIIEQNTGLVKKIALKFASADQETDDLIQLGYMGLLKAVYKFDPEYDVMFSTYAVPMISGEIRRFLRDDGMIKVSRSLRELSYKSLQAREKLTRILGREPTLKELSEELQIDCEEIVQAMESSVEVESIYKPIHQKEGSEILLMDKLEEKDRQEEKVLDRIVLKEVLETLEAKERTIIYLRYFAGKTQAEMGMSQVQVSRTEKKVLERMRKEMKR